MCMVPLLKACANRGSKITHFSTFFDHNFAGNGRKHFFPNSFENSDRAANFGVKTKFVAPVASELWWLKVGAKIPKGPKKCIQIEDFDKNRWFFWKISPASKNHENLFSPKAKRIHTKTFRENRFSIFGILGEHLAKNT